MSKPGPGQGNFQAFLSLVGFVLMLMVFWNVGKVYMINGVFKDKMVEAARSQRSEEGNKETYAKLEAMITELGLDPYMTVDNCEVILAGMSRTVKCTYEREMTILFGFKRKVTFTNETSTPLL